MEAGCDGLLDRLGCADGIGRVPVVEIRSSRSAEWAPFASEAPRETARLATTMYSQLRSRQLDTVHTMRQLEVNARNLQVALAHRERQVRDLLASKGASR